MSTPPLTVACVVRHFIALGNKLEIILQTPRMFENSRQALANEAVRFPSNADMD